MKKLTLVEFLKNIKDSGFIDRYTTFYFISDSYSFLFLKEFFKKFEFYYNKKVQFLDVLEQSYSKNISLLEMSFLGESACYALQLTADIDSKTRAQFLKYILDYRGPHKLFVVVPEDSYSIQAHQLFIELPKKVSHIEYSQIYNFLYGSDINDIFVKNLFQKRSFISLEQAILLMRYQQLLGRNSDIFFKDYLPVLVAPDESLFVLSQYFFAQQADKFFSTLFYLEQIYSIEFWTVYWLEQLWQAILFVQVAKTQNIQAAKALVTRLPFSFIQKDWKKYTIQELLDAHNAIYEFDYRSKNGASELGLTIWYTAFLSKNYNYLRNNRSGLIIPPEIINVIAS